ncbi:uncharacterized protein DEA37_0005844, partial [Paragonimus westermani]
MTEEIVVDDHQYSSLIGFYFYLCSFITFTFIVEAMSITNALSRLKTKAVTSSEGGSDEVAEVPFTSVPVIEEPRDFDSRYFDISQKFEIVSASTFLLLVVGDIIGSNVSAVFRTHRKYSFLFEYLHLPLWRSGNICCGRSKVTEKCSL